MACCERNKVIRCFFVAYRLKFICDSIWCYYNAYQIISFSIMIPYQFWGHFRNFSIKNIYRYEIGIKFIHPVGLDCQLKINRHAKSLLFVKNNGKINDIDPKDLNIIITTVVIMNSSKFQKTICTTLHFSNTLEIKKTNKTSISKSQSQPENCGQTTNELLSVRWKMSKPKFPRYTSRLEREETRYSLGGSLSLSL